MDWVANAVIVKWDDLLAPFNDDWALVTCNIPSISNCALNVNSSPDIAGFQSWYLGTGAPTGSQIDWSMIIHEFGHTVNLNRTTQCTCDRMWPYQNLGEVKRNLTSHDIGSIRAMYSYPAQ